MSIVISLMSIVNDLWSINWHQSIGYFHPPIVYWHHSIVYWHWFIDTGLLSSTTGNQESGKLSYRKGHLVDSVVNHEL